MLTKNDTISYRPCQYPYTAPIDSATCKTITRYLIAPTTLQRKHTQTTPYQPEASARQLKNGSGQNPKPLIQRYTIIFSGEYPLPAGNHPHISRRAASLLRQPHCAPQGQPCRPAAPVPRRHHPAENGIWPQREPLRLTPPPAQLWQRHTWA